jgi:hypothetical protein
MNHAIETSKVRFADAESLETIRVQSVFNPWLKSDL